MSKAEKVENKNKQTTEVRDKMKNEDERVKPMTDEEVLEQTRRIAKADPKEINNIYQTQVNIIKSILAMAEKQATEENELIELGRLKRLISLTPIDEIFIRTKDKIWAVREHILNKNADYFLKKDYSAMIKKDHNQAFMETLIEIIKDKFSTLNKEEQLFYWKKAAILLSCVIRFKKAIGEYDE
jgi:hypothetical protein